MDFTCVWIGILYFVVGLVLVFVEFLVAPVQRELTYDDYWVIVCIFVSWPLVLLFVLPIGTYHLTVKLRNYWLTRMRK